MTFRIYTYQTTAAEFADYDDIRVIGLVDAPPVVSVFSNKRVLTTRGSILLTGIASDDIGVKSVTVNGRMANGTTDWRARVRLKPA